MVWMALILCGILIFPGCSPSSENQSTTAQPIANMERPAYAIAIHGGAGIITRDRMTPEKETAYRSALDTALTIGENLLKEGAPALDAIEATIVYLENNPLFNAGKGAVFTHDGTNEMDASIMNGKTQEAGAVGGVTIIKNPIKAARAVMESSNHVMLVGKGAEAFAQSQNLETVDPSYFKNEFRWDALQKALEKEQQTGYHEVLKEEYKFGTVGCVALDKDGNLAAGTSTGGMTNKKWNRIGDSPIIGAGTYADNATCAVSATGHGEFFIRYVVAREIGARMEYLGESLEDAANAIVMKKLVEKGGEGGIIAVDKNGNIAMPHNSPGMYRGFAVPGERAVKIFGDE
ncbi:MAG: isoaspartyl peptidase/L-asparaginase [Saprospiraceae bacterium]|nr:isoaspartyl peptidase/L-asparaginase [Saprospiraceae bacterium]